MLAATDGSTAARQCSLHEYFGARLGITAGTPVQARLAKPLTTRFRAYDVDGQRLGLRSMTRQSDRSTD